MRSSDQSHPLHLLRHLEDRRKSLGMPFRILAKRAGVGMRTVQRVLSGDDGAANFKTVHAIAQALGLSIEFKGDDINDVRNQRAKEKAAKIVSMVQGTSALESQAVDDHTLNMLRERAARELLGATRARLWED